MKYGPTITKIRKQQHLTQGELALKVGITREHLNRIEKGKEQGSMRTLARIASALNIPLTELLES